MDSESLPYIRNNEAITEQLRQNNPKFFQYYYIPFYRYVDNSYIIGFRNLFNTLFFRKDFDFANGFEARNTPFAQTKVVLPKKIVASNATFNQIQQLCAKHHIDVVYFTAPFCDDLSDYDYINQLKKKVPQLKDYSKMPYDKKYFRDCLHLNGIGAAAFTKMLVDDCIKGRP